MTRSTEFRYQRAGTRYTADGMNPTTCQLTPPRIPQGWGRSIRRALMHIATALLLVWLIVPHAYAQTSFPSSGSNLFPGTLFGDQPNVFADDGRIKVLVLGMNPIGLTESASEQIGLILQKNLNNTGHFAVVGPREMAAAFEQNQSELVDCRDIACGVESGKRLNADKVLVATIHLQGQMFVLNVRLINTFNNITAYQEEVRFTDDSMDQQLFSLVNNISRNSIRIGKILRTSVRGIVISLGARHGLRIGDRLVVYKQDEPLNPLQGEETPEQRKNIGIIKTINVNENTSDTIVIHKLEDPQADHFVKTYLEPTRQIELVEDTRRELDTNIRLASRVLPLQLAPVLLADNERREWQQMITAAESARRKWFTTAAIAGGIAVYFLANFDDTDLSTFGLYGSLGVAGWGVWKGFAAHNRVNDLRIQGRVRGYVDLDFQLIPQRKGIMMGLALNF